MVDLDTVGAFVTYKTQTAALAALDLEGTRLGSMNLTLNIGKVCEFLKEAEGRTHWAVQASQQLWVGNISGPDAEAELQSAFEKVWFRLSHLLSRPYIKYQFGKVRSVRLLRNCCCAFVNFETTADAVAAMNHLNGTTIAGHEIVINFKWLEHPWGKKRRATQRLAARCVLLCECIHIYV